MITQKIKKLRKYLFLISVVFFVLTLSHLTYSYIYSDSKNLPVKWWTIFEWLVWDFPSLNPLVPLYSDTNDKYVINLLYRSILKYDIDKKIFVWDIAKCDISSLINIECSINQDAKWSNWENITTDDILATYQFIKETESNKVLVTLLANTEIEVKDSNIIVFKNTRKDVNFLNVFLQPILNKKIIDTISKENVTSSFPITWWIYSWKFVIDKVSEDESLWIKKLTLTKNDFYDKSNISKIILNIFPDINSFKKNYQVVNVFNDSENNIWNSIYKFQNQKYTLNSFVWIFLNQNNIKNKDLRTYILNKLENNKLQQLLWVENFEIVNNPFLTSDTISSEVSNKNFDSVMLSLWYKKKSSFIQELSKNNNAKEAEKVKVEKVEENKNQEIVIPEDLSLEKYLKKSKTIFSPSYVDNYNFISKDDVLLKWKTPENVSAVYVNDYKLNWFKNWNKEFYYRLKESVWNLNAWKNIYKIYFEIDWKKIFQEELLFIYYHDKNKLKEEEKNLAISIYKLEKEKELNNKKEEIKIDNNDQKTNEKIDKNKELLEKVEKLDENIYYNSKLEEFKLKLYFIEDWKKETTDTVKFIWDSLRELWIIVVTTPFSVKELPKIISNKDDYDMILTWIHLWYLNSNLFPYLHSSQAKTWYNFANIRKPVLDLLVEEMKENIYTEERTKEIQNKILKILKEEQVLKTLYTPKINLLIDKKIKIENKNSSLPYKSERNSILENAYIKEEKVIDLSDKSISWFFKFIAKKLYE